MEEQIKLKLTNKNGSIIERILVVEKDEKQLVVQMLDMFRGMLNMINLPSDDDIKFTYKLDNKTTEERESKK